MEQIKKFFFQNINIRQTIIKNIIWLSGGVTISKILRSIMIIYAARILGAENYGIFSYVISFAAIFNIFSDIGISSILTRELVRRTEKKEYLATSFSIKIVLVILTGLIIAFISPYFTNIAAAKPLMIIMAGLIVFESMRTFVFSISRAENRMQFESLYEIIVEIIITTIGFLVLYNIPSVRNFALGYLVAGILGFILVMISMRKYFRNIFKYFKKELVKEIFKSAWPFAIIGIFGVLMTNIDSVVIGFFKPVRDLGLFAAAQKPISMFYLIPGFLSTSLFPFISRFIKDGDENRLSTILKKSMIVSLGFALPITVGGIIIASPLINVLYGHEYIGAVPTFQLLLLTLIPIFPGVILSSTLLALDKQKIFIKTSIIGATINMTFNLLLIPTYGIVGSAIATILANIAVNGIFLMEVRKNHKINIWKDMRKITVALVLMAIAVYIMKSLLWSLIAIILIAIIIYFGILFLLKEEVIEDIKKGFIS
ncbi:MAG TPA: flippase [Candidatus Paceibacterota bacterium]|nr:flippase [Candidatus Paceibacterota bacterium]